MRRKISAYNTVDAFVECQVGYIMLPYAGYGLQHGGLTYEPPQPCSARLLVPMSLCRRDAGSGSGVAPWASCPDLVDMRGQEAGSAPLGPYRGDGKSVVRGDNKFFSGA